MLRIGFIGLGGMGRHQAQAFRDAKGCRVTAGSDPSADARAAFAQLFPDANLHEDHTRLLADPAVDAVVVSTPTGTHGDVAGDALRARKPVLLEKPMARTVAECRRLIALSKRVDIPLMVAHCRRFDPYWGSWKKALLAGKIGRPVLWRHVMAGLGPGRWFMDEKLGGGPLLDGAVHNYDFANWMFGQPVSVVASSLKLVPDVTAVDTASAVVRYASGDQLMMSWSWGVRGTSLHDVIGPRGFIQFTPGDPAPTPAEAEKYNFCSVTDLKGVSTRIASPKTPSMYVRQARHFLACAAGRTECLSPGTEAIRAVAVAEAILRAGPEGRAVKIAE